MTAPRTDVGRISPTSPEKSGPHARGEGVGQRVARLASRQHGVVSTRQLRALGWDDEAIRMRTARGWLHRVHFGAYAVGHRGLTPRGTLMAALLACGPGAVLSHWSAAVVWELRMAATLLPHVSVPRSCERRPGIRMHRPRRLDPEDVTEHDGFPVTTLTRTVVDLAVHASPARLEAMWEAGMRRGLIDTRRATELCRGRRGAARIKRLLAATTEPEPTRSELERLFNRQCERRGLPLPSINVVIEGLEVDAYWTDADLVVELDSWEFHRTRTAFERDRERDAKLVAAGHAVMRFTWRQLKGEVAWERLTAALRCP